MAKTQRAKTRQIRRFCSILFLVLTVACIFCWKNSDYLKKNVFYYIGLMSSNKDTSALPAVSPTPSPAVDETSESEVAENVSTLALKLDIDPSCDPLGFEKFNFEILVNRKAAVNYKRDYELSYVNPEEYSILEGVTCFRGSNYRQNAAYGYTNVSEKKLEIAWSVRNGSIDIWTGTGWNGQPAIVKWSPEVRDIMNIYPEKKSKDDLKEVIYATLDGKIYFFDADDGKPTRLPIDVGYPHKGSVAVDPRGYPLLYAGQGIPEKNGKAVPIGYRIFSLIDQKCLYFVDGRDADAYRHWGAFDAGPLIDAETDSIVLSGENGIMYSGKLGTSFDLEKGKISIKPDLVKYRYHSPVSTKIGTENSPAIYKNLCYFADNSGLFQCVELNTLKPLWVRDVTDDTDSTTAIEEDGNEVSLYTACELDHHGESGASYIRKLNALTGELLWEKKVAARYDAHTNGGALASPVIGENDIKDLVIYNIAKTDKGNSGKLFALDKKTGKEVWTVNLKNYCWSSPVAVYNKEGKSYIIQCDSGGRMFLFEGSTGEQLDCIDLGSNIEASPAVYENMIVVGTRGQKIYGIKIL